MNGFPWLTVITITPLLGGVIVIGMDAARERLARALAVYISLLCFVLALCCWANFDTTSGTLQLEELHNWIPTLNIQYHTGIDGLGLLMVLLTGLVSLLAMLASWNNIGARAVPARSSNQSNGRAELSPGVFFALLLFLEAGLFGTFTALNFFHWFIFWELSLIPAFFLIKLWGGPLRGEAATQFFVYTMAGSVAMLLSFLAIFWATGQSDFIELAKMGPSGELISKLYYQLGWMDMNAKRLSFIIFGGVFLGFAVKVPLFPLHTWLPSAYAEAPTGVTMMLTGLMSKMGVYGFLRVLLPIFPQETRWVLTPLLWLVVLSIIFSAWTALAQRDLKRLLAYSSINHLGYCLLGLLATASASTMATNPATEKAAALTGVFLQLFNHGLTAAMLFWFAGLLEQRGHGLRGLGDFGGLRRPAPVFCGLMGIALFSSLGLPGLNGFISEFLIFKGAFPLVTWAASLAVLGLLLTALFLLSLLQRVFYGPLAPRWAAFPDLSRREILLLAPGIGLMFILGLYPQALLGFVSGTVSNMVRSFGY
jgi:NADH-quinone oxidoreductase subunit M